ncbi:hypothetical protein ACHQM5_012306 [Ranunculus cassubicifolius]
MTIISFKLSFLCILVSFIFSTNAQTCKTYTFTNKLYPTCIDLPRLNSFLHWNFNPLNRTVTLAYRRPNTTTSTWIAWAINPTATGMVGSQALVAYQSGGKMNAYTSPITSYGTNLRPGNLSFSVLAISAQYSNKEMIVFASFVLPEGNGTEFNHVWQNGGVSGNIPQAHSFYGGHVKSFGSIDFLSG